MKELKDKIPKIHLKIETKVVDASIRQIKVPIEHLPIYGDMINITPQHIIDQVEQTLIKEINDGIKRKD